MSQLLTGHEVPPIEVTKDGAVIYFPAAQQELREGTFRAVPVARDQKIAFPQPIAIAGPEGGEVRRNYDIDEVVITDWTGGMGEDTHGAGEIRTYQYSQCDARWPGLLTNRPQSPQVGATLGMIGTPQEITELGYTNAQLLWTRGGGIPSQRLDAADTWQDIQAAGNDVNLTRVIVGLNGAMGAGYDTASNGFFRTADGVTWEKMATGAITIPTLLVEFDNRIFAIHGASAGAGASARVNWTIYQSVDLWTAAAGAGTWTAGNSFVGSGNESVHDLLVWRYPPDKSKTTLWALTNARLLYYDYYAATPTWVTWHTFRPPVVNLTSWIAQATVWGKNDNLYVVNPYVGPYVWEFTGSTITPYSPNKRGGLPSIETLQPILLRGNGAFLYVFCYPLDPSGEGALLAMAEGGAFSHLLSVDADMIAGGGVGDETLYTISSIGGNSRVWAQHNPPEMVLPQHSSSRLYTTLANGHVSGWLRMGLANTNKRLLYFEVDCIKTDGTAGLNTGATLQVEYRGRSSTSWTSAGTLTSASTFPAVLAIAGGWTFKEMQFRLTLTRGTDTTAAVFLRALKIGFRLRPKARYRYGARVDLRDDAPAFRTPDKKYHGRTASKLRELLDELGDNDDSGLDDTLVGLAYGGHGNLLHPRRRSASQCEVVVTGQESPDGGDGLYFLQFNDVSAPSSG